MTRASASELPRFEERTFRWFVLWLRPYVRRHFDAVRLDAAGFVPGRAGTAEQRVAATTAATLDPETPVIVFSNHPGWWDPLVWMVLRSELFPGRPCHAPIDAAEAGRYGFLRRFGAFPVEQGTRAGAATFLRVASSVLERPGAMLWITAQGRFSDVRERPVRLAGGLGHLAARRPGVTLLPLAIEYTYWDERLPEILVRFGEPIRVSRDADARPADWTRTFEQALEETQDALRRAALTRDPNGFVTLLEGRGGLGGLIDLPRRFGAWLRGEPFEARHRRGRGTSSDAGAPATPARGPARSDDAGRRGSPASSPSREAALSATGRHS